MLRLLSNTHLLTSLCILSALLVDAQLHAQNVNSVIINQGGNGESIVSPSGEIYINGISSKEDIGGVEISRGKYRGYKSYDLYFTNYNSFMVSVVYSLHAYMDGSLVEMTGSIVLQPNESKFTRDSYAEPHDFRLIARRLSADNGSAQPSQSVARPAPQQESLDGVLTKCGGYFYKYPELVECAIRDIRAFINNLNRKKVYGRSNWRLATPTEANLAGVPHWLDIGTSETRERLNDPYDKKYHFLIVCE